jgi:hypothetical protein
MSFYLKHPKKKKHPSLYDHFLEVKTRNFEHRGYFLSSPHNVVNGCLKILKDPSTIKMGNVGYNV